ncbi:MAG: histidine kinase dimerization/phosphoacceptor domain -containing protein [Syntrophales bacterium]|nr:histidine kinase dimerization/phosphoacceptor domain -containing protein [Syntrophales bacterium]
MKNRELYKVAVLVFLLIICLVATYYCHFVLRIEVIFTHLFYVPVILASLWWSRKGIVVAVFLALMLLVSHVVGPLDTSIKTDVIRAFMFVVVGTVVAILSERKMILENKLRSYSKTLEQQVVERTIELETTSERLRQEIIEHKLSQEQIEISLREKEVMLREIHHRVKNNLQVISSLLDMSSLRIRDKRANDLITDTRSKIHSMAIIHSQLYQSEKFDRIEMEKHISELVSFLSRVNNSTKMITPVVNASGVYLSIDQALPCALVLSELISNAFKHAFEDKQKGVIEIFMEESAENMIIIRVKDDGIGIPDEIDIHETDSMGMKLVRNIVQKQLKGEIRIERNRNRGTEFIIEFKLLGDEVQNA